MAQTHATPAPLSFVRLYLKEFVMRLSRWIVLCGLLAPVVVLAQAFSFIDIDTGRKAGLFDKSPVYQRAIMLAKPSPQSDVALLFFRGAPGVWRLNDKSDFSKSSPRGKLVRDVYAAAGITVVLVDCPTDQWGAELPVNSANIVACLDDYRSSTQHADDVRKVMQVLRDQHGLKRFYIQGHSMGAVSSRWLAKNLGIEIEGSIHSAASTNPSNFKTANSLNGFNYAALAAPQLHIHHESDACPYTPYAKVKSYAGQQLVTVRGGLAQGDPCGAGHLHSFEGRDQEVAQTIANWILTRQFSPVIGE
jgi:hypothetical protein